MSAVQKILLSAWLCGGGHHHTTKELAEKCDRYRPAKLRREAEKAERQRQWQAEDERRRKEYELSLKLNKRLEDECRKSDIGRSKLDFRVAFALFKEGATDRTKFRERYVLADQTLDLRGLSRISGITIDDYPAILHWVNES